MHSENLFFKIFFPSSSGAGVNLSSRKSREQWESTVCKTVIDPVLQVSLDTDKWKREYIKPWIFEKHGLASKKLREYKYLVIYLVNLCLCFKDMNRMLGDAQDLIAADNRLSNSPLMKMLRGDPQKILPLPTNCPTHHCAFWSPSPVLTVESLSQQIHQSQAVLLTLFVNKVR